MKFYGKAQQVADKILEAFKSSDVPKALSQRFIACGGRHCDSYSWTNQMLVALAGFSDAMGFKQWLAVGRCVKKGERGTYILAPCTRKIEDVKTGETKTIVTGFRVAVVFGLEQTEVVNAELWAKHNKARAEAEKYLEELPLRAVAEYWGLTVKSYQGSKHGARGWYRRGQAIALGVENLATWAHELCHAADDKNGKLVEHGQHWRSETVAELGGAILMYCLGYERDADVGGAWEYISAYANTAKIEPIKACMDVLKRCCEAVALILKVADELSGNVESDESDSSMAQDDSDVAVAQTVAA
jgi:antirestriction protein ArdC